jgi:hypothetical protein
MKRFKALLISGECFVLSHERVPARGSRGPGIDALSLIDNPSEDPALDPCVLRRKIKELGIDPIVHLSAKEV